MSLNWKLSNIPNWKELCYETFAGTREEMQARIETVTLFGPSWAWTDETETAIERMAPTTYCLVFASTVVGLGEITEENVDEFYRRISVLEGIHGAYRIRREGEQNLPHTYTLDEIRAHIGLKINVADVPKREWNAQMKRAAKAIHMNNVLAQA
jgi:hypothetical protein